MKAICSISNVSHLWKLNKDFSRFDFTRQYGVVMNILVLDLLNFLYNNLQYIVNFLSFPGCYISSKTFITNLL